MSWFERAFAETSSLFAWAITAVAGGVVWLLRVSLTNREQIELLKSDLKSRSDYQDTHRQEMREDLREVRSSVHKILERLEK